MDTSNNKLIYIWHIIKHKKIVAFGVGFLVLFAFLNISNYTLFYHDSRGYWIMSGLFFQNGIFTLNIANHAITAFEVFHVGVRGYVYPLMLLLFRLGTQSFVVYWFSLSLFLSFLFTYIAGNLFEQVFECSLNIIQRLIPLILTVFFWPGLILYPLTDVVAVMLSVLSLYLLVLVRNKIETHTGITSLLCVILGALLYATYNIRGSFILNIFLCAIAFIFIISTKRELRNNLHKIIIPAICAVGGMLAMMLPQMFINYTTYNVFLPTQPLTLAPIYPMMQRLRDGMIHERYETIIHYYAPVAVTIRTVGRIILENEGLEYISTFSEYIGMVIRHPFEFLGAYFSRFINGIDSRFGEIYIYNLSSRRYIRVMLNYICFFITLLGCFLLIRRKNPHHVTSTSKKHYFWQRSPELTNIVNYSKKYGFYILYLLLPLIFVLPMHTEPRFYISLHLFVYFFIAFLCPYREIWINLKKHPITIAIVFVALFGLMNSIWNWTFSNFTQSNEFFASGCMHVSAEGEQDYVVEVINGHE